MRQWCSPKNVCPHGLLSSLGTVSVNLSAVYRIRRQSASSSTSFHFVSLFAIARCCALDRDFLLSNIHFLSLRALPNTNPTYIMALGMERTPATTFTTRLTPPSSSSRPSWRHSRRSLPRRQIQHLQRRPDDSKSKHSRKTIRERRQSEAHLDMVRFRGHGSPAAEYEMHLDTRERIYLPRDTRQRYTICKMDAIAWH